MSLPAVNEVEVCRHYLFMENSLMIHLIWGHFGASGHGSSRMN